MFLNISYPVHSIFTLMAEIGNAYPIQYSSSRRYMVQLPYYLRPPIWCHNRKLKCWKSQTGVLLSKYVCTTFQVDTDCSSNSSTFFQCLTTRKDHFQLRNQNQRRTVESLINLRKISQLSNFILIPNMQNHLSRVDLLSSVKHQPNQLCRTQIGLQTRKKYRREGIKQSI